MCECGGELVECVCGDRCCDDCGCRDDYLIYSDAPLAASPTPTGPEPATKPNCTRPGWCACDPLAPGDEHCQWFGSVKRDPTNGASIVPGLVERVQWAGRQIDEALADSRVDGAAAAWLRTIKRSLFNASGDVTPEPTEETPNG